MRSCRASSAVALLLICAGCGGAHGPTPELLAHARPRAAPLPGPLELEAARLATLVLAEWPDDAAESAARIATLEAETEPGAAPPGLADNAAELLAALDGYEAYLEFARQVLERGSDDPRLERRLQRHLDAEPLVRAEVHNAAHRRGEVAAVFNRLSAPLSRAALGGVMLPIEAGRAALSALLITHDLPEISTRERQELRAYEEFLARHPDAPESAEIAERVAAYRERLALSEHDEALEVGERALAAGAPRLAMLHVERAERLAGPDERSEALRIRSDEMLAERDRLLRASEQAEDARRNPNELAAEGQLARALLRDPPLDAAQRAEQLPVPLSQEDERAFVAALGLRARGDEDGFADALGIIAAPSPDRTGMSRHARWLLANPNDNPYGAFRKALGVERSATQRWLWLGRYAHGRTRRDLPRPVEWLLDVPGFAISLITIPQRMLQFSSARGRFGQPVILAGERYVARRPGGTHSEEVHAALETRYARQEHWSGALRHYEAREQPDPEQLLEYRSQVAERALAFAGQQTRIDVRMSIYASVARDYPDTPQAAEAQSLLRDLVERATPQEIRVSRGFLQEHPALWQPDALGLRPELFDGDGDELSEEGITLLGQTAISIALEDREPELRRVPLENFARFVALLEEISYERLVSDTRERPQPDPQRDLFFERARFGLLEQPDMRPSAGSHAVFLSSREKYGLVRRGNPLPVEFVIQGGLSDLGLAAFPRVRPPAATPDAFLYR